MKDFTSINIGGQNGYLFYAVGTLPFLAFVPEALVSKDGVLDRNAYLAERWAYANNYANPKAAGSHIWPDMDRPAPLTAEGIDDFRERLAARIQGTE